MTRGKAITKLPQLNKMKRKEIQDFISYCGKERHLEEAILEGAKEDEDVGDVLARIKELGRWIKQAEEELGRRPVPYEILTEQDLEELGEDETPEVIEGLLKEGGSMMIVSPGGIIKSWLGQLVAECRASGRPFLGRYAVRPGNSLIIDAENLPKEIRKRLRMIRKGLDIEITDRLWILSKPDLLLDNEKDVNDLIELLRGLERMTIIIDPLIRFHTGNENSSQEMARVTRTLNRIQRELGATLVVLQHQTKPGFFAPKGRDAIRGSTELLAWPDVILMVDRKDSEYRAQVVKNRYGLDGQTIVWDTWFDEEEGRVDFAFVWEDDPTVSREEKVKGLIADLFEDTKEWTVREIHQALKAHRVGQTTIREMLKELEADEVIQHRTGPHNRYVYFGKDACLVTQMVLSG